LPDGPIGQEKKRNEENQGEDETAHENGIVKTGQPPDRGVVESGPQSLEGSGRQNRQSEAMEKRVQEIGYRRKNSQPQEKSGEVHPEDENEQNNDEVV